MFPTMRRPLEHAAEASNGIFPTRVLGGNSSLTIADETLYRVSALDSDGNQTLSTVLGTTDAAGMMLFCLTGETDNANSNNKVSPKLYNEWDYIGLDLSGVSALDPIYLSDAGIPATTAGANPRIIGYVGYAATAANKGVARICPERVSHIWPSVFSIQANSSAVTGATASGGTFAAFNKSVSIPARCLHNGSVVNVVAYAKMTGQNGTDTGQMRLKFGGDVVVTSEALDIVANDICRLTAEIHIRGAIGASQAYTACGTAQWSTSGGVHTVGTITDTVDGTAAVAVTVEVTYGSSSASNTSRLEMLNVKIERPIY